MKGDITLRRYTHKASGVGRDNPPVLLERDLEVKLRPDRPFPGHHGRYLADRRPGRVDRRRSPDGSPRLRSRL